MTPGMMPVDDTMVVERQDDLTFDGPDLAAPEAIAVFDSTRKYRYWLTRKWGYGHWLHFCMLNPSTADAFRLDPTVTNCVKFAKRDGFGGIIVTNLFAVRSPYPSVMRQDREPIGPANDIAIRHAADAASDTVVAWGTNGTFLDRDLAVLRLLPEALWCFSVNKDGTPTHPLYQPKDARLVRYEGSARHG
jgi:hypothetical protein